MGGGSDTTQNTASQSVQQFPPWINDAAQQNYAFAQNVAQQPLQQYQGQMVADVGPQTQQAWNTAATGGSAGQDQYNASQAGYLGILGSTPASITPTQAALAQASIAQSGLSQAALARSNKRGAGGAGAEHDGGAGRPGAAYDGGAGGAGGWGGNGAGALARNTNAALGKLAQGTTAAQTNGGCAWHGYESGDCGSWRNDRGSEPSGDGGRRPAATGPAVDPADGMNLQGYMNPYTQAVINQTLPIMQQEVWRSSRVALQNPGQFSERLWRFPASDSAGRPGRARRAGHGPDGGSA